MYLSTFYFKKWVLGQYLYLVYISSTWCTWVVYLVYLSTWLTVLDPNPDPYVFRDPGCFDYVVLWNYTEIDKWCCGVINFQYHIVEYESYIILENLEMYADYAPRNDIFTRELMIMITLIFSSTSAYVFFCDSFFIQNCSTFSGDCFLILIRSFGLLFRNYNNFNDLFSWYL